MEWNIQLQLDGDVKNLMYQEPPTLLVDMEQQERHFWTNCTPNVGTSTSFVSRNRITLHIENALIYKLS